MDSKNLEKKIYLYNRYRQKTYIEHITDNKYRLIVDVPYEEDFTRYGYDSWPDDISFVDPSGGPFIRVGENNLSVFIDGVSKSMFINISKISVVVNENKDKILETILEVTDLKIND